MDFYSFDQSNTKRNGVLIGLLIIVILFVSNNKTTPLLSSWSGDSHAAGDLSGSAIQVGQGNTLVAPPDVSGDQPWGNPVVGGHVVMTQGYGEGSHAPAGIWGAIDLAIDGNGDGFADPQGSLGAPIRATMDGFVQVSENTWPAGNHVWVIGDQYKTGYAHLLSFDVQDGQYVQRGDIIGRLGSTGSSSGPHLDYQIWLNGVNQNPLDYHVLP